jgi:ribonucleases P/MRP protein subunit RPP40
MLIRDELVRHMADNNQLEESQHGIVNGRSCATNLIEFLGKVTADLDSGNNLDLIFLDFAKAFDKVPRLRLLAKLKARGVRGKILQWIDAWLSNREQRVVVGGGKSGWRRVLSGVPQGSVLGPILFLIFIEDLDDAAGRATLLRKFADDTKLAKVVNLHENGQQLQESLNNMCEWTTRWGMKFNAAKYKVMHIGRGNARHNYFLDGHQLDETELERDIGVMESKNLKHGQQCEKAAKTTMTVLGQITRAFTCRDKRTFVALYKRYARPNLEFAVQAWSPWLEKDKEVLEKVQKRAVNQVQGLRGATYEQKLEEIGLDTLEYRRKEADMVLVYKVMT